MRSKQAENAWAACRFLFDSTEGWKGAAQGEIMLQIRGKEEPLN